MKSERILTQIIGKGGMMGNLAGMYIHDKEKSVGFIIECLGHCQTPLMIDFWGSELVEEIKEFVVTNKCVFDLPERINLN